MIKKCVCITICLLIVAINSFSSINKDSIDTKRRLEDVEYKLKRIDGNELNYKIEKDLLKETYSNNYQQISLVITIVLAVIGFLGYIGLKDINSVKKEYEKELAQLKSIKDEFEAKSKEFDTQKDKLNDDLRSIIKENQEQSAKIKVIELKEKIRTLLTAKQVSAALEFVNAALDLSKDDIDLLNQKGRILCRLNQLSESCKVFLKAIELNPTYENTILNLVECLYFANDIEKAKLYINSNKIIFESEDRLLEILDVIEYYHKSDKAKLIEIARKFVTVANYSAPGKKMKGWDLDEALYFIMYQIENDMKVATQSILRYFDGQITGQVLFAKLGISLEQQPQ